MDLSTGILYSGTGTPTWTTCSDSPCTEAPFIGSCSAVDSSDVKQGVTCTGANNGDCAGTITEHVSSTHFSSSTIYSYVDTVACAGSKTCEDGTLRAAACTGNSTNNVEVQLATYNISKLNDLQNLDRTVNDLTVDTLHGLGPELYANPLAKAGSATGTQTIVSCDFPGQVVDVACSDPTKTTEATCVASGICSDTSHTTEVDCLAAVLVTSGASLAASHANSLDSTECQAYADADAGLSWQISSNFASGKPMGCFMSTGNQINHNTATSSTQDCDTSFPCVQKSSNTWTPRTWSPATYVCTSPTTWTPIAGESSIALKGANPDTIVQNSGSYTDVGGVCYDGNGTKVDGGITVSGQVVDATAACDTEFTLLFDCAGAAQVSRKVVVECS